MLRISESKRAVIQLNAAGRRAARAAGLRYIVGQPSGILRHGSPKRPSYRDASGQPVRDEATQARIRKLAIPPAWRDVWICADPDGHLQATGYDARGRKQYRYHPQWSAVRTHGKHQRVCDFAARLPRLRAHCQRRLQKPCLSRECVLAALLRIVDLTGIRVGHDEYTRENASFGLTTLRVRHARVQGDEVELNFRGKSGVKRRLRFRDARIAQLVAACRALRGPRLFKYLDDAGRPRSIHADHVNEYLRALTAGAFSVKDFRTWSATVSVALELRACGPASSQRAARKQISNAVRKAAEHLGNTPAVCRSSYVHPILLEAYAAGETLPPDAPGRAARTRQARERAVLAFLEAVSRKRRARNAAAVPLFARTG